MENDVWTLVAVDMDAIQLLLPTVLLIQPWILNSPRFVSHFRMGRRNDATPFPVAHT